MAAVACLVLAGLLAAVPATRAQEGSCWDGEPSMDPGYAQWSEPPHMIIDPEGSYTATLETNRGTIVVDLLAADAPQTVNNFVCLALAGYYDVTVFHRIIVGFMIQGGDPTGTGSGGPGYQFADELPTGETPYTRGTVAMANAGANTNGSQFFIVQEGQGSQFPSNYSIFGRVVEGMEVVDAIAGVPVAQNARGEASVPLATIGIASITIMDGAGNVLGQESGAGTPVAATAVDVEVPAATELVDPEESEAAVESDDDDDSAFSVWVAIGIAVVAGLAYFGWRQARSRTT